MKSTASPALGAVFLALLASPAVAQNRAWIRQLGTSTEDYCYATASDGSGGVYIGGITRGSLGGQNAGSDDAWLAHYDGSGNRIWIRQLGTNTADNVWATALDGSGGVYVSGRTYGSLGGPNSGNNGDTWFARYDGSGNQIWIRQLGTSGEETSGAVATDGAGGVYVSGGTNGSLGGATAGGHDVWLARYDSTGNQTWIRQFGTSGVEMSADAEPDGSGGVYLCGFTTGSLGGPNTGTGDAWLARCDASGSLLWIRQFGTIPADWASAVATDGSGGAYVCGGTSRNLGGPFAGGPHDVWLARYDGTGNRLWIRQLGTDKSDVAASVAPDSAGGVYIGGYTGGSLGGPFGGGLSDAWLAHYDGAGTQTWIQQFGTSSSESTRAVAPDGAGGMFVSGQSDGSLGGPNAGGVDAWLAHYEPCGSATPFCTSSTTTNGCSPSITGIGSASTSAPSGFTIRVANVEGQRLGLIFYGIDNAGWSPLPWASGSTSYLCVKAPTQRMNSQSSGGTSGACDGSLSIDWNAFLASYPGALGSPFAANANVFAQGWFRDPTAPGTSNLSNGLQFSVCP